MSVLKDIHDADTCEFIMGAACSQHLRVHVSLLACVLVCAFALPRSYQVSSLLQERRRAALSIICWINTGMVPVLWINAGVLTICWINTGMLHHRYVTVTASSAEQLPRPRLRAKCAGGKNAAKFSRTSGARAPSWDVTVQVVTSRL